MNYRHTFRVRAPLDAVAEFHTRLGSLIALTPLPIRLAEAPDPVREGDEIRMTLWLGPIPARWHLRVEDAHPAGMTDRQLSGPFRAWSHKHTFVPAGDGATDVVDEIRLALRPHILWGPFGFLMYICLPLLFIFRAWKTRRMLRGAP